MAGDEVGHVCQLHAHRPQHGKRMSHDRRLRILREPKLLIRPVTHYPEKVLPQRFIDLVEYVARRAAGLGKHRPHAD